MYTCTVHIYSIVFGCITLKPSCDRNSLFLIHFAEIKCSKVATIFVTKSKYSFCWSYSFGFKLETYSTSQLSGHNTVWHTIQEKKLYAHIDRSATAFASKCLLFPGHAWLGSTFKFPARYKLHQKQKQREGGFKELDPAIFHAPDF